MAKQENKGLSDNGGLAPAMDVLRAEADAISALCDRLDDSFLHAAEAVLSCETKVVLTGIGKAGIIAQKISATLASTGTQSIFLHPVEALHGDLGRVSRGDVIIALSHSGQTEEMIRLADHLEGRGAKMIAITAKKSSPLGRYADITIPYGSVDEACPLGLAPSVSTSCMLAIGDALALTVMRMRKFTPEEFAEFHPAGAIGRKLLKVEEAMTFQGAGSLPLAEDTLTLADALTRAEKVKRRTGAMLLVDKNGKLSGILTDADIRRILIERRTENILAMPVAEFMTANPKHIKRGELAGKALAILNEYRIDELPVVDENSKPIGIIDVQDLLGIKTLTDE